MGVSPPTLYARLPVATDLQMAAERLYLWAWNEAL